MKKLSMNFLISLIKREKNNYNNNIGQVIISIVNFMIAIILCKIFTNKTPIIELFWVLIIFNSSNWMGQTLSKDYKQGLLTEIFLQKQSIYTYYLVKGIWVTLLNLVIYIVCFTIFAFFDTTVINIKLHLLAFINIAIGISFLLLWVDFIIGCAKALNFLSVILITPLIIPVLLLSMIFITTNDYNALYAVISYNFLLVILSALLSNKIIAYDIFHT